MIDGAGDVPPSPKSLASPALEPAPSFLTQRIFCISRGKLSSEPVWPTGSQQAGNRFTSSAPGEILNLFPSASHLQRDFDVSCPIGKVRHGTQLGGQTCTLSQSQILASHPSLRTKALSQPIQAFSAHWIQQELSFGAFISYPLTWKNEREGTRHLCQNLPIYCAMRPFRELSFVSLSDSLLPHMLQETTEALNEVDDVLPTFTSSRGLSGDSCQTGELARPQIAASTLLQAHKTS
ncbi:uncharacterized protein BJX67DRAFT_129999 [Aspergillus lucknowensis]|uniref:Uncharacterized protein n=1 Tax=Aspergillus lucknowensis TaxID=176173 RepID=A0ABR4LQ42_9EURO